MWRKGCPSLVITDDDGDEYLFQTKEQICCLQESVTADWYLKIIEECKLQAENAEKMVVRKPVAVEDGKFFSFKELIGFLSNPDRKLPWV
ncbi:MAG: hypothetical protein GF370_00220 [Candidatus Nealsonbacteria bacterium]|nr:hypothetical protein [Candidatus Nealsonbacteria bacterium]